MPKPIAVKEGICFAFPDILLTPAGTANVPVPYPNIAQLSEASGTASDVNAGGKAVIINDSEIDPSTGGEAGTGESPSGRNGKCTFTAASATVNANGKAVVRQFDGTSQNGGNAVGMVMNGVATVLVGG